LRSAVELIHHFNVCVCVCWLLAAELTAELEAKKAELRALSGRLDEWTNDKRSAGERERDQRLALSDLQQKLEEAKRASEEARYKLREAEERERRASELASKAAKEREEAEAAVARAREAAKKKAESDEEEMERLRKDAKRKDAEREEAAGRLARAIEGTFISLLRLALPFLLSALRFTHGMYARYVYCRQR
jgi:hypothetical protein